MKFHKLRIRKGMTLIEIVVVVSILGLLMALMATSISGLIRPSAKDTTDKMKAGHLITASWMLPTYVV